jgi:hypothetical protein
VQARRQFDELMRSVWRRSQGWTAQRLDRTATAPNGSEDDLRRKTPALAALDLTRAWGVGRSSSATRPAAQTQRSVAADRPARGAGL